MKKTILLIFAVLAIANALAQENIPASSYNLTNSGKTLYKWKGEEKTINMQTNSVLREVTTIGKFAFKDNKHLEEITFPNGLKTIGEKAFESCYKMKGNLKLPEGLLAIGDGAFSTCSFTGDLKIPTSVKKIGRYAFIRCDKLNNTLTLPENPNFTTIEQSAFYSCHRLSEVKLPKHISLIEKKAFSQCYQLFRVTCEAAIPPTLEGGAFEGLPEKAVLCVPQENVAKYKDDTKWKAAFSSIVAIGEAPPIPEYILSANGTFLKGWFGKPNQTSLNMETDPKLKLVTTIGTYAFLRTKSELETLVLPNGLRQIHNYAFPKESNLKSITIPKLVDYISGASLKDSNLEEVKVVSDNPNFMDQEGVVFNKTQTKLIHYPPKKGGKSYTVPRTVERIDDDAFYTNRNLEEITLQASINSIGAQAFFRCLKIKKVTCYVTTPPTISENTFKQIPSNPTLYVPPASVTAYKADQEWKDSFSEILEIEMEYQLSDDGKTLIKWRGTPTQTSLDMQTHQQLKLITTIGESAFSEAKVPLTSLKLPEGLLEIKTHGISGQEIESIHLPESLEEISRTAFIRCTKLKKITVNAENPYFSAKDGVLFNKDTTTLIYCPEGKKASLYVVPETVKIINNFAFYMQGEITRIGLLENTKSIGNRAFSNSKKLKELICEAEEPPRLNIDVFKEIPQNAKLTVQQGYLQAYKAIPQWNNAFKTIEVYPTKYKLSPDGKTLIKWKETVISQKKLQMHLHEELKNITTIDTLAFRGDKRVNLELLSLPDGLIEIKYGGLGHLPGLTSIHFNKSLKTIGDDLFLFTSSLKEISVDPNNQYFYAKNGVLYNKTKTTLLSYPPGKEDKAYSVFSETEKIKSSAFENNKNLEELTIMSGLKELDKQAISGCSNLKKLICYTENPPSLLKSSIKLPKDAILYVPAKSVQTYKNNEHWNSSFKKILPIAGTNLSSLKQNGCKLWSKEGRIYIKSEKNRELIVYNLMGIELYKAKVQGEKSIELPTGAYIVNIDGESYKIVNQ